MELNSNLPTQSNPFKPPFQIKRCPSCDSVFISDLECESCGVQFDKDFLGTPLGLKSFYALKEQFESDMGIVLTKFPFLYSKRSPRFREYIRSLKNRFQRLSSVICKSNSELAHERKVFLIELKELSNELKVNGLSRDQLLELLESTNPEVAIDLELLHIVDEELLKSETFWRYRIFNLLSIKFIFLTTFFLGALIYFSLLQFEKMVSR